MGECCRLSGKAFEKVMLWLYVNDKTKRNQVCKDAVCVCLAGGGGCAEGIYFSVYPLDLRVGI